METVRLTIQLRDHNNTSRYTRHVDVALSKAELKAGKIVSEMAGVFRKEKKAQEE